MIRTLIAAAALALATGTAYAHSDDFFDSNPPADGGQIRMAGPYHFHLMPQQAKNGVLVKVTDHADQKVATAGWSANAVVLSGGKKSRIALKPGGDNILTGTGALGGEDAKIVVSIKDKAGKGYSARFTPATVGAHAHDHEHAADHDHAHEHDHDHMHQH